MFKNLFSNSNSQIKLDTISLKHDISLVLVRVDVNFKGTKKDKNRMYYDINKICKYHSNINEIIIDCEKNEIDILNGFIKYKSSNGDEEKFFTSYKLNYHILYCIDFYLNPKTLVSSVQGEFINNTKMFSLVDNKYTPVKTNSYNFYVFDTHGFYNNALSKIKRNKIYD